VLSIVGSDLAYTVGMDRKCPILEQLDNPKAFSQIPVYSKSKLLLLLSVAKLAEFVDSEDVVVNVTNPGMAKGTQMLREVQGVPAKIAGMMYALLGRSVPVAASNYVYSTVVLRRKSHGSFTSDWGIKPYPKIWYTAEGPEFSNQLWEETLKEFEFSRVGDILKMMKE